MLPGGDRTLALVIVRNTTSEVRWWQGGGCDFVASITVATAAAVAPVAGMSWNGIAGQFKNLLLSVPAPSSDGEFVDERFAEPTHLACTADLRVNKLPAGQQLEMRAVWNGEINGAVAAPGPARVTASFPYLGLATGQAPHADQPQPIAAAIDVTVGDTGIHLLSPGQAVDAALRNPEFAAWLAAAGEMRNWTGVDLQASGHTYIVVLIGGTEQGRATVDRQTGAVSFERKPKP